MFATSNDAKSSRLGEVIETSSLGYWAESDDLHRLPVLGELVEVRIDDDFNQYGIVTFGQTGSIDPSRRAVRRGDDVMSDEAIYVRHPELELILRTVFRVASVGYTRDSRILHSLPPLPVPLHYSVRSTDQATIVRFCEDPHYVSSLVKYRGEIEPGEVIAAHLRWADELLNDDHCWLSRASRRLARSMKRDYDDLVRILEAVAPQN